MTHRDLNPAQLAILAECYADAAMPPLDKLPYTADFEHLYGLFRFRADLVGDALDRSEVWRALSNLRKTKKLVRKRRPKKEK